MALAFVLGLQAWFEVAVDTAAVVEMVVVVRVEVEVGKFEEAVREFVGFEEGSLIAGGVPAGCLGCLGLVFLQGTFSQAPSSL